MENLKEAIAQLKREKNAVVLGHYYQRDEIQEIADFVGDSLALAQWAARTEADIIVMCGVHFMGETAKILCPDKKVLVPDSLAGCSLADSCPADRFAQFIKEHPGHTVISYVNTTAAVKALTDVVVPSTWDGACSVHEQFSVEKLAEIKRAHPGAVVLAHPECKGAVLKLADVVGSTAALLRHAVKSDRRRFIVATESGILHEMRKQCPDKEFIPAPPNAGTCACNECNFMRLNTLEKLYACLRDESPAIEVAPDIAARALRPIERMLDISAHLGL